MRILIPTVDYPPIEGGIATVSVQLARELAALGHAVTVIAPQLASTNPQYADTAAFDADEPVRIIRFPGYERGWLRLLPLLKAAWPEVKTQDLILSINITYGGILGRLARLRYGTPYITFAYAYEFLKFLHTPVIGPMLRHLYAHSARVIAISNYTRDNLIEFGLDPADITLAFPGTAPPAPVPQEEVARLLDRLDITGGKIILCVGRFIPRKGQLKLVKILPHILEHHPQTHLVLVGRGPLLQACRDKARALEIDGFVHCPGYLEDRALAALYEACDVFALPAGEDARGQVEGFGLVCTEAHAHGKPVVAGHSGGLVDAVQHNKTGLLVPPESEEALSQAIIQLLDAPQHARQLGEAGRKRIEEELNWRIFAEKVLSSYSS